MVEDPACCACTTSDNAWPWPAPMLVSPGTSANCCTSTPGALSTSGALHCSCPSLSQRPNVASTWELLPSPTRQASTTAGAVPRLLPLLSLVGQRLSR